MNFKLLEILKSMSSYGIAIIFMRLTPFFSIPLILKNISIKEYGELGYVQAIVMTIVSVATLNIASSNFRFLKYTDNQYVRQYNKHLIASSNSIVILGAVFFSLCSLFFLETPYKLPGVLLILTQAIYSYFISLIRAQNKSRVYSAVEIGKNLTYFGILLLIISYSSLTIISILYTLCLCNFLYLTLLYFFLNKKSWTRLGYSKILFRRTLFYSLPTLVAYLIQTFLQQSPLMMIDTTDENLGRINYANKISLVIFALQSIVFLAWPYFAYKYQEQKLHQTVFKSLSVLLISLSWVIYFAFDWLTLLISNKTFLSSKHIAIGFIGVYVISVLGNMIDTAASIANKTYLISVVFICGFVVGMISYIAIPNSTLNEYPFIPLMLAFSTMVILRVIVYTKNGFFKSWDNYTLSFVFVNVILMLYIS
ncbi:lipopolysaccharide biosynthesis protein [Nonlabens marinus]|uniref:The type 2 capsule locus of Streptococcus pneumoniae n=1 Tax=Nonlabens marinus S1-08 TaxID=1454201 RepID=W8W0Q5_9FLAO|nr:hypothetical protein [Nonlabens marinus]BAO56736.1 the type 2 capsule locus of Streptococcus pneumoniae [Nonlabens marinus S1-08]